MLIEVCGNYGIPATSVAIAFGVGADSCFTMAPVIASTYLGLAVSGMSLKDVMKTNPSPLDHRSHHDRLRLPHRHHRRLKRILAPSSSRNWPMQSTG